MFAKLIVATLITVLVQIQPLWAETPALKSSFSTCAQMEGDLARLDCFDQLAKKNKLNSLASIPTKSKGAGDWLVSREVNPIDDSETVYLRIKSHTGKSRYGRAPELTLRCKVIRPRCT